MTSEYLITVITGIRKGAGTDASVSLIIKGNSSKTYRLDYHCCSANGPAILTWAGARTRFDSGGIKKECKVYAGPWSTGKFKLDNCLWGLTFMRKNVTPLIITLHKCFDMDNWLFFWVKCFLENWSSRNTLPQCGLPEELIKIYMTGNVGVVRPRC